MAPAVGFVSYNLNGIVGVIDLKNALSQGKGFFKRSSPRPSKPIISKYAELDQNHKIVYDKLILALESVNKPGILAYAFGSRVSGRWWSKEEDPRGKGSDWDIFVESGTAIPSKEVLSDFGLGDIVVDVRAGKILPPNGVKLSK